MIICIDYRLYVQMYVLRCIARIWFHPKHFSIATDINELTQWMSMRLCSLMTRSNMKTLTEEKRHGLIDKLSLTIHSLIFLLDKRLQSHKRICIIYLSIKVICMSMLRNESLNRPNNFSNENKNNKNKNRNNSHNKHKTTVKRRRKAPAIF